MKYIKTFKDFLNEVKNNDIVFFPGRFQPFHKGHLAALKKTAELFGKPVVAVQILSQKDTSPFPETLLIKMAKDIVRANPFIKDFVIYPQGRKTVIPLIVRYLRELGYEPYGLGSGADRLKEYQRQVEYITSPKSDTPVDPSFSVKLVDTREDDGPSGTKVRKALANDDRATFNDLMPEELHKYYEDLKKYVKK